MRLNQWLLQKESEWGRLASLLEKSRGSIYRLSSEEIRTITILYRSLLNDLTRVKSTTEHQGLIPYLNQLACQTQAILSENKPQQFKDIIVYFMITFPQCFRRNWKFMAAATSTFLIGTALAMLTVYYDPSTEGYFLPPFLIESLSSGKLWTEAIQAAPSESTFLMANNIRVAIMAFTYGLFFGIGSLFVLFQNGMTAFGGPLQVCFN
ncbi:MAG: stage II sporulation protein M, partial [Cyanobacteria bacterium]|nr:stage II sporulation protein M [Cyanobacteriota bacterium]